MSDGLAQITKRELQATAQSPRFWIGLICVVCVLALSAPFDTAQELNLPQRFAYWLGIAISTYFVALLVQVPVITSALGKGVSEVWASILGGFVAGPPIGLVVFVINSFVAQVDQGVLYDLIRLILICTVISVAAAGLRLVIVREPIEEEDGMASGATSVGLLKRLPPEKRGMVLTLNAQDHYVEVTTSRGRDLLLLRLGDAVEELTGLDGLRVHRSWWVNRSAVDAVRRVDGRMVLALKDGREVPVSRANEKAVKTWQL